MPTDIQRIRREVAAAALQFAIVEAHPTSDGGVSVSKPKTMASKEEPAAKK